MIHGWNRKIEQSLVVKGHRLVRQELSVKHRDSVVSLTSREENVLEGGRAEGAREKWVGDRLWRLWQKESMEVEAEVSSGGVTPN